MPGSGRVAIFIDGSNFYHSLKDTFGLHDNEVDFRALACRLSAGRLLVGVYYYNASLDRFIRGFLDRKN